MILSRNLRVVLLAGLAGGFAEILWVGIYSAVTRTDGAEVLRQIVAAVIPAWSTLALAPALGVIIHLVLSVTLSVLCCRLVMESVVRRFGASLILPASMAILALVWVINFLVILPVINPAFVTLMPFLVTLASKLLFACAMGGVLRAAMRLPAHAGREGARN